MAQASTDWIEWAGGECPVHPNDFLQVQFRCESREKASQDEPEIADDGRFRFIWTHDLGSHDIIAYRVVSA